MKPCHSEMSREIVFILAWPADSLHDGQSHANILFTWSSCQFRMFDDKMLTYCLFIGCHVTFWLVGLKITVSYSLDHFHYFNILSGQCHWLLTDIETLWAVVLYCALLLSLFLFNLSQLHPIRKCQVFLPSQWRKVHHWKQPCSLLSFYLEFATVLVNLFENSLMRCQHLHDLRWVNTVGHAFAHPTILDMMFVALLLP